MDSYKIGFHAPKVSTHNFGLVPKAHVERSKFRTPHTNKITMGAAALYPIYLNEVLPGDSYRVNMSAYCRLATPLYPILDALDLEIFYFFCPARLLWVHWEAFMGAQNNPADSISYVMPQIVSPAGGFAQLSIYDYFGIPTTGQTLGGNTISVNALPFRAYNLICNEWFRDQDLQNSTGTGSGGVLTAGSMFTCLSDDGPDAFNTYFLFTANKRHDYFTSARPWTQKGGVPITMPLGTSATVKTQATALLSGTQQPAQWLMATTGQPLTGQIIGGYAAGNVLAQSTAAAAAQGVGGGLYPANLYADLSTATAPTINAIRTAVTQQQFLERDARGGTRYVEVIKNHFGVRSPDARLSRPEFLSSGKVPVIIAPVPQTTATGLTGGNTPIGTLSGAGTATTKGVGFSQSFTEHGYVIGLACIRRDQVYQQGIRKLWSRSTRWDWPWPEFAHLGEQAVLNQEIYSDGSANDALVFGYQERYAEMRFHPSTTCGYFRSTNTTPLDAWHLATKYAALPVLNAAWVRDDTQTSLNRVLAAGALSASQQLLCDFYFDEIIARPLPAYGVPGLLRF